MAWLVGGCRVVGALPWCNRKCACRRLLQRHGDFARVGTATCDAGGATCRTSPCYVALRPAASNANCTATPHPQLLPTIHPHPADRGVRHHLRPTVRL